MFKNAFRISRNHLGLIMATLLVLTFGACQDDPYLEPTIDGEPIVTPKSKVYITGIQINTYPSVTPMGDLWDVIDSTTFDTLGLPDIFFNLSDPSPNPPIFWSQPSHFSNVSDTVPAYYTLLEPYFVEPFGSYIDVNVYDYELPDSTFMGKVNFFLGEFPDPSDPQTAYPSSVTKFENGYSISIGLKWED